MNMHRCWLTLIPVVLLSNIACSGSGGQTPSAPTPAPSTSTASAAITASQTVGVQAATPFTFSVQTTDFEAGALSYRWEFGDDETSSEAAPTHIYSAPGARTVVVTVSNGRQSSRSEMSVTVYTVTGTWESVGGTTIMHLAQSGSAISGDASVESGTVGSPYTGCPITGSVEVGTPAVILLNQPPCPHPVFARLVPMEYRLGLSLDGQGLFGTRTVPVAAAGRPTDPITMHRK